MKPRELCEKAWQEIASKFPDFKVVSKGQKLKKTSKNKDLIFEIYFQANRNNYADSVEFVPHIAIYVNVNIRMYNFDDVQCTVIPSVAYGFVTGMNLQLC